ncbi:MAG: hypothetical protein K2Y22_08165 [Candidatus Obscuribacterales bacterium]|nr:hypothetical protein [Candidatus Obscuribacterales bacterium]
MTTAIKPTPVEAKWDTKKVRETVAEILAVRHLVTVNVLSKYGESAIKEFEKQMNAKKAEWYKHAGVKTPVDLVKAMAEFEANIFGSKIKIEGDEKKASLTYEACAVWNAMQKHGKFTPNQQKEQGEMFEQCIKGLGQEFGFKAEIKFEEPCATITFSK